MTWKLSLLVVANRTADSDELLGELSRRAARGPVSVTLVVPPEGVGAEHREAAALKLAAALERMRAAGLQAEGRLGDVDPVAAVHEAWDPARYDEVVVSTLPTNASKWLMVDLPRRIERVTGVPVTHIVSTEKRRIEGSPAREHSKHGVLSPLTVLTWGSSRGRPEGGSRAAR